MFCVQIPCGRGSVLLWRRCDTGAESDVYECLAWFCNQWLHDSSSAPYRTISEFQKNENSCRRETSLQTRTFPYSLATVKYDVDASPGVTILYVSYYYMRYKHMNDKSEHDTYSFVTRVHWQASNIKNATKLNWKYLSIKQTHRFCWCADRAETVVEIAVLTHQSHHLELWQQP